MYHEYFLAHNFMELVPNLMELSKAISTLSNMVLCSQIPFKDIGAVKVWVVLNLEQIMKSRSS